MCGHSVNMETFGLHELILYVIEDLFSVLLCIHNVNMEVLVSVHY